MDDNERHIKAKEIFFRAVEADERDRERYVALACAGDEALGREVLRLLGADSQATQTWENALHMHIATQIGDLEMTIVSPCPIGEIFNRRYFIQAQLGRGNIGATYLAEDRVLYSRPVTVKLLLDTSNQNQYLVDKFKHESEALARITHPGVVSVLDLGTLPDGTPYIVMEFVKGKTLADETRSGGMDLQRAAVFIRQIAQALTAAHFEGVVHRDLKPANVMIQNLSGNLEQAKLIDFGIAKVKNPLSAEATLTPVILGSPAYMAPEQIESCAATPASDIYALGILAYEMLTGHRPFAVDTKSISWVNDLVQLQRSGVSTKPMQLRPDLPRAAQAEILRALEYDANRRQQKAFEFGESLYRALTHDQAPAPYEIDLTTLVNLSSQPLTSQFSSIGQSTKPVSRTVQAFEQFWSNATFTDRIRPLPLESALEERKRRVRGMGTKPKRAQYTYRLGSELCIAFDVNRDGYLTLLDEGPEGIVYCLCPSQFAPNARFSAGRIYLPQEDSPFQAFELSGAAGKEKVLAVISDEPLRLDWLPSDTETPARVLNSDDIESLFARLKQRGEGSWMALSTYFDVLP